MKALIVTALTTLAGLGLLFVLGTLVGRTFAALLNRRD